MDTHTIVSMAIRLHTMSPAMAHMMAMMRHSASHAGRGMAHMMAMMFRPGMAHTMSSTGAS